MVEIHIPEKVNKIIHTLQEHGYEAYAVGGCVRVVSRKGTKVWDITTSADAREETKALFPHTFDTGIEHGTITVLLDHEGFEVTTYRVDGKYEDSRHPKEVIFVRNLQEDLLRRDFTINAMAYNEKEGLVDIFGGMDDLKAGIIRCVRQCSRRDFQKMHFVSCGESVSRHSLGLNWKMRPEKACGCWHRRSGRSVQNWIR